MATVLDVSLLGYFNIVFSFFLILVFVYAILQKYKVLGDSPAISGVIAFAMASIAVISETVIGLINFIAPWFVVMFIFLVLLLLMFQMMGATEQNFQAAVKDKAVQWTILAIAILIIGAGFANVLGQDLLEQSQSSGEEMVLEDGSTSSTDFESNVMSTIFHPKVLGMIVLFGIAIFSIALLTNE